MQRKEDALPLAEEEKEPLVRQASWPCRLALYLGLPFSLAAAGWVSAGRLIFGAAGQLLPVLMLTLGPSLLLILLLAYRWMLKDARCYTGPRATTPLLACVQAVTGLLALIFGFLCPDRIAGRTVSAAAAVWGEDFIGLSAGFANTFGILTFCSAFSLLLLARSQYQRSQRQLAGLSEEQREELERSQSPYEFLDDL